MRTHEAVPLKSRCWHALAGSARLRDSVVVIVGALLCSAVIFGLLYALAFLAPR